MIPALNRRLTLPFYIPVISLICSLLLINSKKTYFHKVSIFIYSFVLLLFTEIGVKYTGLNETMKIVFIFMPLILFLVIYSFLILKFSKETFIK